MEKRAIFQAAAAMALIDGEIQDEEGRILDRLAKAAGLDASAAEAIIEGLRSGALEALAKGASGDADQILAAVIEVAAADEDTTDEELDLLEAFGVALGQAEDKAAACVDEAVARRSRSHQVASLRDRDRLKRRKRRLELQETARVYHNKFERRQWVHGSGARRYGRRKPNFLLDLLDLLAKILEP